MNEVAACMLKCEEALCHFLALLTLIAGLGFFSIMHCRSRSGNNSANSAIQLQRGAEAIFASGVQSV